jgi:hypothetical protein
VKSLPRTTSEASQDQTGDPPHIASLRRRLRAAIDARNDTVPGEARRATLERKCAELLAEVRLTLSGAQPEQTTLFSGRDKENG